MNDIAKEAETLGIFADVQRFTPTVELKIFYGQHEVKLGNELTPTLVKNPPTIQYEADPNAYYTLVFTDPDAPSRAKPIRREWRHWVVGNIPGNNITAGKELTGYVGSAPPPDTGLHRYIFILYKQPKGQINFKEDHTSCTCATGRANWKAPDFAAKYGLEPVGINFYQAKYDDYVPEAYKKLTS